MPPSQSRLTNGSQVSKEQEWIETVSLYGVQLFPDVGHSAVRSQPKLMLRFVSH